MSTTFADKSGRGILLAAINRAAKEGFSFKASDLTFGAPEATTENGKTTKVVYTATESASVEGSQNAYFDKLDLTGIFTNAGVTEVQVPASAVGDATSTDVVVAALNKRYSTGFSAEDILSETFEADAEQVTLNATPGSYGFQGSLVVNVVKGAVPLADAVDPVLGDLGQPAAVPVYLTDVVIGGGDISAKAKKEDGTLLAGTNNPSTDLWTANNGEIELALGARIYQDPNTVAPVDGKYTLAINDASDWNFPISIALLQEARPVTDLYDVTLTLKSNDNGSVLPFTLHRDDEGVYHFVNEGLSLDINDNAESEADDVVQNIQRVKFYADHLGDLQKNGAGSPLGSYTISLSAERREGLVPVVELSIDAEVSAEVPA